MLGFLKGDPKKKLQKAYEAKLAKALHAQRNRDLRSHGTLMEEAEKIYAEIRALGENP
ncbi:DUF6435 family protein [Marinobacter salexigens]|uniref:DUF6435 family protein n=1 Tax=Marinobacter salexigens TaxID=1925763 RepID=UPI0012900DAC|nr:DUF6435 family protein [Marinobacter salexigens]